MVVLDFSFNYKYVPTQSSTSLPPGTAPISQTPVIPKDQLRLQANADSGCCLNPFEGIKNALMSFCEWISSLFAQDTPSDPALLAKWDMVVLKDYDSVGATNPFYLEEVNACQRGKTIADHFVRAASKTGVNPCFQKILVQDQQGGARVLFTCEGSYTCLEQRVRNGEFNNPNTLILLASYDDLGSETRKQSYIQHRITVCQRGGFPVQNATFFVLEPREVNELIIHDRMPKSLLDFLKARQQ